MRNWELNKEEHIHETAGAWLDYGYFGAGTYGLHTTVNGEEAIYRIYAETAAEAIGYADSLLDKLEGVYDLYAIDSYNPIDGKCRRLFVGSAEEARRLMATVYAVPTDREMQPFYRCALVADDEARAYLAGEYYELPDERVECSITEAAGMLGVTRQRVHAMLKAGKLHGRKIGNTWSVDIASVENRLNR